MVKTCCVRGCKTEAYAGCGISFHKFPKDEKIRKKWHDVVPIRNKVSKHSTICGTHFNFEDFATIGGKRILKLNAVPSIFNQEYWIELKARTKTKVADSRRNTSSSCGSPNHIVPLNVIEERVLALMDQVAGEGLTEVQIPVHILTKEKNLPDPRTNPFSSSSIPQPNPSNSKELQMEIEWLEDIPSPVPSLPTSSPVTPDMTPINTGEIEDSQKDQKLKILASDFEDNTGEDGHSSSSSNSPLPSRKRKSTISRPSKQDPNVKNGNDTSLFEKFLDIERQKLSEMREIKSQLQELNEILKKNRKKLIVVGPDP